MSNYYVRYYQDNDPHQTFQQFLQAIASAGLQLHTVTKRKFKQEGFKYFEYITVWEYTGTKIFLESSIDNALRSKRFKHSG